MFLLKLCNDSQLRAPLYFQCESLFGPKIQRTTPNSTSFAKLCPGNKGFFSGNITKQKLASVP